MDNPTVISVTGLGYVGLPAAVAFAQKYDVLAFDFDPERIEQLKAGIDHTLEVSSDDLRGAKRIKYTTDPRDLSQATIHMIVVPTPINDANEPDLRMLIGASHTVGKYLKCGDIVIYESSVYPGATEEDCVPVLEFESGLNLNKDFSVGYSPERINPGDKQHVFKNTNKVVSASNNEALETIACLYESVIDAKIHRAPNIKVAETAKIIENTQRDVNIALMNELAHICHRLDIDTGDVLEAAGTKWNFLPFTPGLVGGHCIGVDPYYLTHRAERTGYNPEVILAGRRINDEMGRYIAQDVVRHFMKNHVAAPRVTVLGVSFKENVPDIRNTRVIEIVRELQSYGVYVQVSDPLAHPNNVKDLYKIELTPFHELKRADGVILAVAHDLYLKGGWDMILSLLENDYAFVSDVKCILDREAKPKNVTLWRT
jgi:UDP-N-acetyl-D-galactosamine dehydrogenase